MASFNVSMTLQSLILGVMSKPGMITSLGCGEIISGSGLISSVFLSHWYNSDQNPCGGCLHHWGVL